MKVALIGAGKMGLPIAAWMASRGMTVTACDIDGNLVAAINRGECPFDEPGLPPLVAETVAAGRLGATTDTLAAVAAAEAVVVIVPALIDAARQIDLAALDAVTREIRDALHPGLLVCYETTVAVGTVRGRFVPLLEESGLRCGEDFHVCFSPERVKSRLVLDRLAHTPKVVGGFDEASTRRGEEFYAAALGADVLPVGGLEAAEFTKLLGMLYRDMNIALVNQVAHYAEAIGIDLTRIIPAANTNGEAHLLQPGIGVGGHCTPVYPWFIIGDAARNGIQLDLASASRQINDDQAEHAVGRLDGELGDLAGRRILILGLAFRPEVKEAAFTPALLVRDALVRRGVEARLHDDHYADDEIAAHGFRAGDLDDPEGWEALILVTAHEPFLHPDFAALAARGLRAVMDGRNLWAPEDVRAAGVTYLGIGR